MTAMLTEQTAQAELHSAEEAIIDDPFTRLTEENREQAAKQLANAEEGTFVTYSSDCVGRPSMKAFWYSQEHGWQEPESSAVPICLKDFAGKIVFGLFHVVGIERPEPREGAMFARPAGPPLYWKVRGDLIIEGRPEKLPVQGRFVPDNFSGEVIPR